MVFKALHNLRPTYLKDRLLYPTCQLQWSGNHPSSIPPFRVVCLASMRARAFFMVAPAIWNRLSEVVNPAPHPLKTYRVCYKTSIFGQGLNDILERRGGKRFGGWFVILTEHVLYCKLP